MEEKNWYAAVMDDNDLDFSKGSYDWDEANEICERLQSKYIATVECVEGERGLRYCVYLMVPRYYAVL